MKDAYSFDLTAEAARKAYQRMFVAYLRTFCAAWAQIHPHESRYGPYRRRSEP